MSIPEFRVKEQWLGTGLLTDYTFDFTIQDLTHLLLILQNSAGVEVARFRGDDTTYLSGVVFDAKNGGGTVSLLAALQDEYVITALLAPDAPTQPSEYKGKFSFSLELFELAMDRVVCQIQRLAYLVNRSLKLSDLDDATVFNMTLPPNAKGNVGAAITINDTGTGIAYGATLGQIAAAITYAVNAAASAAAAVVSAASAAASAAAAAASAGQAASGWVPFGTRAIPLDITAAGGITSHGNQSEFQYIHGSPGAVILSGNPQISAGTAHGQLIRLVGRDDTNTVKLVNGTGLSMNGDCLLGEDDSITFFWDTVNWVETGRRTAT